MSWVSRREWLMAATKEILNAVTSWHKESGILDHSPLMKDSSTSLIGRQSSAFTVKNYCRCMRSCCWGHSRLSQFRTVEFLWAYSETAWATVQWQLKLWLSKAEVFVTVFFHGSFKVWGFSFESQFSSKPSIKSLEVWKMVWVAFFGTIHKRCCISVYLPPRF